MQTSLLRKLISLRPLRLCASALKLRLALAFNAAADRCIAIGLATNVGILGDEEWQPLADYGDTAYWREEDGQWKKYTQRLTRPQAEKMVAAINRMKAKQGAHFRGLPIYRGHPDADPKQWPDDARYGAVMDLEAREGVLCAKLAWNDLGQRNKEQGYYIYPSPAWLFDERDAKATGVILPDVLQSVGLTNTPRIPSSKPWTNSDPCPDTGVEERAEGAPKTKDPTTMYKKHLLKLLGLPDDASDSQIEAAAGKSPATNTQPLEVSIAGKKLIIAIGGDNQTEAIGALTGLASNVDTLLVERDTALRLVETNATEATTAKAQAAKFRALAMNSALDRAIDAGRITAAERAGFETKFAADFDATLTELNGKKVALNSKALDPLKPASGADLSTPRGRSLAFNARVDELIGVAAGKGHKISIDDAINQMRANPEDAALLKAMEPAASN